VSAGDAGFKTAMTKHHPEHNENSTRTAALGLLLIIIGVIAFKDLLSVRTDRVLPSALFFLSYLSLPMLIVGVVSLLRAMGRLQGKSIRKGMLTIGLFMLLIGGFPWIYTDMLVGGRPGNEGSGMLGTILFILVGLPGLAVTVTALFLKGK